MKLVFDGYWFDSNMGFGDSMDWRLVREKLDDLSIRSIVNRICAIFRTLFKRDKGDFILRAMQKLDRNNRHDAELLRAIHAWQVAGIE